MLHKINKWLLTNTVLKRKRKYFSVFELRRHNVIVHVHV